MDCGVNEINLDPIDQCASVKTDLEAFDTSVWIEFKLC